MVWFCRPIWICITGPSFSSRFASKAGISGMNTTTLNGARSAIARFTRSTRACAIWFLTPVSEVEEMKNWFSM